MISISMFLHDVIIWGYFEIILVLPGGEKVFKFCKIGHQNKFNAIKFLGLLVLITQTAFVHDM